MRITNYTVKYRDTECAECASPFDVGDRAFIILPDDDATTFCSINCATRYTCDRSLQEHIESVQAHSVSGLKAVQS